MIFIQALSLLHAPVELGDEVRRDTHERLDRKENVGDEA